MRLDQPGDPPGDVTDSLVRAPVRADGAADVDAIAFPDGIDSPGPARERGSAAGVGRLPGVPRSDDVADSPSGPDNGKGRAAPRMVDGGTAEGGAGAGEKAEAGAEAGVETEAVAGASPEGGQEVRVARSLDYQAKVRAVELGYAIDQAYDKLCETESGTVTPALRHIESADPTRCLAGLEHRLKGKDRLTEKVTADVEKKGRTVDQALANVKDAIRYTFIYPEADYAAGVRADCERLENAGFERFDRRNSWDQEEYKGINTRWRISGTKQMFEVQFHTQASLDAKEETHWAYEGIRAATEDAEVAQLHAYQRAVTSKVPIPPEARDIQDYRF